MIIGIGNNNTIKGKEKIKKYFNEKNYLVLDIDGLTNNQILTLNNKKTIDKIITDSTKEHNVVIDLKNISDYKDYLDLCDYIIEINHNNKINEIGVERTEPCIIQYNPEITYYNLSLNINYDGWEERLENSLEFNFNNNVKVSIVVPIYNASKYLNKCIDSILKQSYKNIEILLIDDGSVDNSLEIITLYSQIDKRIKVIHQKNAGLSATRNKGIEIACGDYIAFIDADDYIEYNYVEVMLKQIINNNADICECGMFIHNKDNTIITKFENLKINRESNRLDLINAYANDVISIATWDKLYKLSAIKNLKFRTDCFKEDSDFTLQLCKKGLVFTQIKIPLYHYIKKESDSLTANKFSERFFNLAEWAITECNELLSYGSSYQDAADKILYNSYVHILKYYLRDYNKGILKKEEFKEQILNIYNSLHKLIINTENVYKYRCFNNVIDILKLYLQKNIFKENEIYKKELPCIGIIWNSLNGKYKNEIIDIINKAGCVNEVIKIDLKNRYENFIKDIYVKNHEAEGIPFIKYATLKDQFENNEIVIVRASIPINFYEYTNNLKGFQFESVATLKRNIRNEYKQKIDKYAFDNIFHLTMNNSEFELTDKVLRKYIDKYEGEKNV
ncbi:MAG: glycosyltransferase family 2 protein [Clostridia bacterium]|nr:glycosyltransferase family 2 protein [Clostridia bacterium]